MLGHFARKDKTMNKKLKFLLNHFEIILASAFILFTTVLVVINVFLRYFLNTGITWSEEVATGSFVWGVFVGSAAAYRNGGLIGVDLLVKKFPTSLRRIVEILIKLILVVINVALTWLSVVYVMNSYTKPTPVLGVSSAWISSSLIVGFGLSTIYSVMHVIDYFKAMKKGEV